MWLDRSPAPSRDGQNPGDGKIAVGALIKGAAQQLCLGASDSTAVGERPTAKRHAVPRATLDSRGQAVLTTLWRPSRIRQVPTPSSAIGLDDVSDDEPCRNWQHRAALEEGRIE